ncbi:hypothetical protein AAFG07_33265 [Bradyrhizobium sp. B097]|uniref:hypothetical protein n=1 Tax=Bradyrhizobium sp. B097 TaxID=3140244 RepID=UPI0031837BAC
MIELVYQPKERKTLLALYSAAHWTLLPHVDLAAVRRLIPFSPENNLIKNNVVLLPSEPRIYDTEERLVSEIRQFIHRYVDLSPTFEHLATYYVLLSWLYDAFAELPYLRLRGDFGTGKTRALLVIGSICYKPFFASGASTVSPLFHTLDAFRGTMIFDEADFRFSDERAEITKILNNGNVRGLPVLRTMIDRQREFNPRAFQVFGPKIVATRGIYEDKALESRFLTEDMGGRPLRSDVPINLPDEMHEEARELRNKLLLFRFHRRFDTAIDPSLADVKLQPRSNQILLPLLSIVKDPTLRDELRLLALNTQESIVAERGLQTEAQVLEILASEVLDTERMTISIAFIATAFIGRFGTEYDRPITNRWTGGILRRRLHIKTHKSHGIYVVPEIERERIRQLCDRYGVQRA